MYKDIKIFAKNEKEQESFLKIIWICSQDIRMEFWIENCDLFIMEKKKQQKE